MALETHNKAVVIEYARAFSAGDINRLISLFAENAEIQGVLARGQMENIRPVWEQLISGYGIQLKIESLIAEGNQVAARFTETGTFRAPAFGQEPTGRSYELVAMEWFEIANGKITRRWGAREAASQARQLGIPVG